jgi:hypothetical protein
MEPIDYFVPGIQDGEEGILPRLRWPIPPGVTEAYVAAYTEPGEGVLVPYCQGAAVVREILSAGRRAIAVNFDALLALVVRTELAPPSVRDLDATVARVGDSFKQGVPLRHYLAGLYATTCPACQRPAVADYFVWDQEQGQPVDKYLRCAACGWDGRAAMEPEDTERLKEVPTQGMHYHYVLDRVSPPSQERALRSRLEYLLELYTPRNLYALAELTLKIESLYPQGPLGQALKVLLVDCLDRCSSLAPLPGRSGRRRSLRRPGRFLERNVWLAFEEAAVRLRTSAELPPGQAGSKSVPQLAASLEAFYSAGEEGIGVVDQRLVRDLPRTVPPRSLRLILTSPPPLDSAAWSLSYLWGGWSLGAEPVAPLRSLLRQRTPDTAWYARVIAGSLATLVDLLRDDGRLVLILTAQRPTIVEALALAASQARMGIKALVQRGADYRLELTPAFLQPVTIPHESLDVQIRRVVMEAMVETIRACGEPVAWPTLHAAIQQRLAQAGLLTRAAERAEAAPSPLDLVAERVSEVLDSPGLVRLVADGGRKELWWLAEPGEVAPALCDRVEIAAYKVLQGALALTETDLAAKVYAQFPGPLTPDADLVAACLRAYGNEPTPGYWQLRTEDLPEARQAERQKIIERLLTLGRRLGYRAEVQVPFDVAWFDGEQARAVFAVRWQAVVGEALTLADQAAGARFYLVIPGGRAALVSFKLARNPLWQEAVDKAGWWFVKYRHVRQLVDQPEVDEYTLRTIVGLDPIVERETAQLPLF